MADEVKTEEVNTSSANTQPAAMETSLDTSSANTQPAGAMETPQSEVEDHSEDHSVEDHRVHAGNLQGGTLDADVTMESWTVGVGKKLDPKTWYDLGGKSFPVRVGPNYSKFKKKAPSLDPLYACKFVDVFNSKKKIYHFGAKVKLPAEYTQHTGLALPPVIIIAIPLPDYSPPNPVFSKSKDDGDGQIVVYYFVLTPQTLAMLKGDPGGWSPAVKLLSRFVRDKALQKSRFKVISRLANLPQLKLPTPSKKLAKTFNATPFLAKTSTKFFTGADYFEISMDLHKFSYASRAGLMAVKKNLPDTIFDVGFLVQGETNEELPECLLGSVRMAHLDLPSVKPVPDYMMS